MKILQQEFELIFQNKPNPDEDKSADNQKYKLF